MYITNRTAITGINDILILPKAAYLAKYHREKLAIEEHYQFLNCRITSKGLICEGVISDELLFKDYEVYINFDLPKLPKVFITNPKIEFDPNIHMYRDHSLCLYYYKDLSYSVNNLMYDTIVPWTSEWLIFYELYKLKDKWLAPFKSHSNTPQI